MASYKKCNAWIKCIYIWIILKYVIKFKFFHVMSTKKMCFFVWWAWKKWFFSFESLINLSRRVERELNFFSTRELRIEITSWEEYEIPWNVFFRMMNMKKMIFFFWIALQSKWTNRKRIKFSLDSWTHNQNYFVGRVWNFIKNTFHEISYSSHKLILILSSRVER